jgi:hypothetical protein
MCIIGGLVSSMRIEPRRAYMLRPTGAVAAPALCDDAKIFSRTHCSGEPRTP